MCCARSWATSSYHPGSTGVTWRPSPFPFSLGHPEPQVLAACMPGAPCPAWRRPRSPRSSRLGGGGQALCGTPAVAVPRAGAAGGGQRWAVRPVPALPVGNARPRTGCPSRTSPPPRSSIQRQPLRSLPAPVSALRGHTDKIRGREETAGRGEGGRPGGAEGLDSEEGSWRGAREAAVLHTLHVLRWFLSVSDLKPNTCF